MRKPFANRFNAPRLGRDEAERQGRVSRLAFEALRQPEAVIAFLNTHDAALGGRPIDLAIAGEDSMRRVEQAIAAMQPR